MIRTVDSVKATTNLWGERWSKLCVNGMHNGVSAATGLSGNDDEPGRADPAGHIRLGGEAVRVGQALGYSSRHRRAGCGKAGARHGRRPAALDEVEIADPRAAQIEHPQRARARRWARTCTRAGAPRSTSSTG